MLIAVIGSGALGSVFAGVLAARLGDDKVVVVTRRPEQAAAIRSQGLAVQLSDTDQSTRDSLIGRPTAVLSSQLGSLSEVDAALVFVKAFEMDYASGVVAQILSPRGIGVTLLNGLGNYERLAEALGPDRAVAGTTNVNGRWLSPGRALWPNSPSGLTVLGFNSANEKQVRDLADRLNRAGLQAEMSSDLDAVIWTKLAMAVVGPVSALVPGTVGTLAKAPAARDVMDRLSREILAVAKAKGVHLDADEVITKLQRGWDQGKTDRVPSMLEDALNGRPTEIEARFGAIVREGRAAGVDTPATELIYLLVTALDQTRNQRFSKTAS